jgi:hypothetical protein
MVATFRLVQPTHKVMNQQHVSTFDKLGRIMFNDPAEMLQHPRAAHMREDVSWTNETIADIRARALGGDISRVAEAEKIADDIEVSLEASGVEFTPDVSGGFPNVAAFLANDPECMVRRRHVELSERAPVRVFVCTTSSGIVGHAMLAKRGVAALALTMALIRQQRAVELYTFSVTHGDSNSEKNNVTIVCTKMRTAPVDISSVAWCMTAGGYQRTLSYAIAEANGFNGAWPSGKGAQGIQSREMFDRETACRRLLGDYCAPSDVVLCNVFGGDEKVIGSPLHNPTAWVKSTLARVAAAE